MLRRSIITALARYSWRIPLLWLSISAPVVYLIYTTVPPNYEAISRIRIAPSQPDLYDPSHRATADDDRSHDSYLQTQISLVTTDRVLSRAIASPSVTGLPMIQDSQDPMANLREKLVVGIEPGTYMIKVTLQSPNLNEPAAIVNAVVDSYLDENLRYTQSRDAALKASVIEQLSGVREHIDRKKAELREWLQEKASVYTPPLNPHGSKTADGDALPAFTVLDEQHVNRVIGAIVQTDLDLLAARAELAAKREAQHEAKEPAPQARQGDRPLEDRIKVLQKTKESYARMYEKLQVAMKAGDKHSFGFAHASEELATLRAREEQLKRTLAQVEFQSSQEPYRVMLLDKAEVPKLPASDKRWRYMAAAPVAVLFILLGFFLLVELRAVRLNHPDQLSLDSGLDVYLLPPLPTARSLSRKGSRGADYQVEQFIQQLDQVWFAVCGNEPQPKQGQCVLLTSAVIGEGKTTLAVQLAARCSLLGMRTLLIDADFRRTAVCSLLDIPEGRGLSDILRGEGQVPADMLVSVKTGTFQVLRAGTPVQDTCGLLRNPSFGSMIARFREKYEVIIIDAPPVLPVPDALVVGRWADRALLAARYDVSRVPLIKAALYRLDGAGIAVLAIVLQGGGEPNEARGQDFYTA
jgi:Mrp family chromosome partitioning ATPase/uncharacterized protein involved in exopolysaccharide biosynthesis